MPSKKTVVVLGSTGAQGGGVARALLREPEHFGVRAVTRDASSAAALDLAALGADVVEADIDDETRMAEVLQGADGAYLVTFYWAHMSPERETTQIEGLARAARKADVRHVIWSTLEDTRLQVPLTDDRMPTLLGSYKVPHFDVKGAGNHWFTDLGVPTTLLHTGFYWENFIDLSLGLARDEDGTAIVTLPLGADGRLASIASEDIGKSARGIFHRGEDFIGQSIGIAGGHLSGQEFAAGLSTVLQEPVTYRPLTYAQFRALGFPGAEDLGNMFQYNIEFEKSYRELRNLERTREINPEVQSFADWATAHQGRILLP